jgi:hypothetical protein
MQIRKIIPASIVVGNGSYYVSRDWKSLEGKGALGLAFRKITDLFRN